MTIQCCAPGLLFILLVLGGCASTPQSQQIFSNGLNTLPLSAELTNTPFFPQTQHQCGPAALATVLQAYKVKTTPEALSSQVYLPERQGSLQVEMTAAARRHGMLPYPLDGELTSLLTEIAAGNPVLVLQNLGLDWYPNWHYAVVIGYDTETREIILRSGESKRRITPFTVFERTWQRADFWALVIVPAGTIPATAEPLRYLKSAYAFEETGKAASAFKAYQAASIRWPDIAATWLTLGNLAYATGDWDAAIKAFNTACELQPEAVTGWNNLAYALHAKGCKNAAQEALQCGLKIAPGNSNLHSSMKELTESPVVTEKPGNCPAIICNQALTK